MSAPDSLYFCKAGHHYFTDVNSLAQDQFISDPVVCPCGQSWVCTISDYDYLDGLIAIGTDEYPTTVKLTRYNIDDLILKMKLFNQLELFSQSN